MVVLDFGLGRGTVILASILAGGMATLVSRLAAGMVILAFKLGWDRQTCGFSALTPEPLGCGRTAAGGRGGAGPYPDGSAFHFFVVSCIR